MTSKFTDETRAALLDLLVDGLTMRDACRELGLREKTVKGWLTRGRKEKEGEYRDFAEAVGAIREDAASLEQPMNPDELELVISRAAKKGSVQAMKLLDEIHRRKISAGEPQEPDNPFDALDADAPIDLNAARERMRG